MLISPLSGTLFVPREHAFPIKQDKESLLALICSFVVYFKWSAISGVRNIDLFDLWRFKKIIFLI